MTGLMPWLLGFAFIGVAGWLIIRKMNSLSAEKAVSELRAAIEKERAKARDIADQVDNDVGAMPPDRRREELKRW